MPPIRYCLVSIVLLQFIHFIISEPTRHTLIKNSPVKNVQTEFLKIFGNYNKNLEGNVKFSGSAANLEAKARPQTRLSSPVMKLIKKLSDRKASKDERINAFATFVTEIMTQQIVDETEISPNEITNNKSLYVCLARGRASGLRSISHKGTSVSKHANSVDLHITYAFQNLHLYYGIFYLQLSSYLPAVRGALDMDLDKNEIELVLTLPKMDTIVNKLLKNECIIRLKDFTVLELEYGNSRLTGRTTLGSSVVSSLLNTFLRRHQALLRTKMESKVLEEIRRTLGTSGNFICNDQLLADLVLRKGGSLDIQLSDRFDRYCTSNEQ